MVAASIVGDTGVRKLRAALCLRVPRFDDDDGTVTVDFVVLTAALATLGVIAFAVIRPGIYEASSEISEDLSDILN